MEVLPFVGFIGLGMLLGIWSPEGVSSLFMSSDVLVLAYVVSWSWLLGRKDTVMNFLSVFIDSAGWANLRTIKLGSVWKWKESLLKLTWATI